MKSPLHAGSTVRSDKDLETGQEGLLCAMLVFATLVVATLVLQLKVSKSPDWDD